MSPRTTLATLATGLFSKFKVKPSLTSAGAASVRTAASVTGPAAAPKNENDLACGWFASLCRVAWSERGCKSAERITSAAFCGWSVRCSSEPGVQALSGKSANAASATLKTTRETPPLPSNTLPSSGSGRVKSCISRETSLKNTSVKNNNRNYCRVIVIITVLLL
jgi:hypothetical protein